MLSKFTRFALLLTPLWFLHPVISSGQISGAATISGPHILCVGECGTYLVTLDSGNVVFANWSINGSTYSQGNPVDFCGSTPGIYVLTVNGFSSTQNSFNISFSITVISALDPVIVSTSAACPADSTSACQKVCANSIVTYEAQGVPAAAQLTWTVQGATSYVTNGNKVTVEWGAPGQGQVALAANAGTGFPMQMFTGQKSIDVSSPGTVTGGAYVSIFDGMPPYLITITGPNGFLSSVNWNSNIYQLDNLGAGTYLVTVQDANGNTAQNSFDIVLIDSECWSSALPVELAHASGCNACDGFIQVQGVGGNVTAYTYQWSNGATTPSLNNLCPGTYTVTMTDAIGCATTTSIIIFCSMGCSGSTSLCVNVLEEPQAIIASTPPAAAGVIAICQGQTVYFQNQSLHGTSYAWDFGDFNTSARYNPSHQYNTPGTYNVSLIARNECYCADTAYVTVYVIPADVPDIQCVGTICEGETVTYSTSASCGTYTWNITGSGNILDGGGPGDNFITVEWTSGPQGSVSLAVNGCAGTVCNLPNVVPIPIISDNVEIQGPDKVCQGSTQEYFIPGYEGTQITWSVVGSGTIKEGQGTERITVHWFGAVNVGNPQRVIVEFENCYLGCSGKDTLLVGILPQFYIKGPIEVCQNTSDSYQSRNAITNALMNSNWTVLNSAGTAVWNSAGATNTANIPWNFPAGKYTVRATPASASGFCNDKYEIFVKVGALPPKVTGIQGATEICPGTSYAYEAMGNPPNDFKWTINNGGIISVVNGNPVNVTWGASGPRSVSVAQVATTGLGCISDTITMQIGPIPNFTITGDAQVCEGSSVSYSAPVYENAGYNWTISPADAGTVISGQNTSNATVQWNTSGAATMSVTVCGAATTVNLNVNVLALPQPMVPPTSVCAGETATVTTTTPYVSYVWKNESGTVISTASSVDLGGGNYEVEVTDANGCAGDGTFFIEEHPLPSVSISTPAYYALCTGGPPATIYALNTGSGYDYQWTLNGSLVGGNTPTYSTTTPGTYRVEVTDVNGCTALSNPLTLVDCEAVGGTCIGGLCYGLGGGPPVPGCTPAGTVNFNAVQTSDCNIFDFVNTSTNFIPGSFEWYFDDPASGANNFSNLQDPSHTFTAPGYYTVILLGDVNASSPPGGSCKIGIFKDVLVPAAANFDHTPACPNAPATFTDQSAFVAGGSITGWQWDFGDPASGAANTSSATDPTHIFGNTGSYTVTLTITMASGCQTSISKTVNVQVPPSVSFMIPDKTCENTALPFDAILSADVASVEWNFGDPSSGAANISTKENTFHSFDVAAKYTVTLTATNINGCTANHTEMVIIDPNTLSGNITQAPASPICEGDSTLLTAPSGGISYLWSNSLTATSQIVKQSNTFTVTLTDAKGCTYTPPASIVNVVAEPNGIIKAVEYNEFGQPVAFFENSYSVCEGEDVYLTIQGSLNYTYVWSTGSSGNEISFTDDKNNQLVAGMYSYTVTVTDATSGCTSVEGPFTVNVNALPDVMISSVPSGFICENTTAVLSVNAPQPGNNYVWNTGEPGTSITVVSGGTYFARAINSFGCEGRSNEVVIQNAPDIGLVPSGCHTRCKPDTMCLPNIANVASYQWYLDGSPMAGPNGTQANPIFTQSGTYQVVMTDIYGCTSTSSGLSLDLFDGFGDILGNVYFDVNGNGVIDAPDTLVSGVNIFLNQGGSSLDTVTSAGGGYVFLNILTNNYTLVLDTLNLPPGWYAILSSTNLDLVGCDVEEHFDWLLTNNCVPSSMVIDMSACEGDSVLFDGVYILAGEQEVFVYTDQSGCDSTVIVAVLELPNSAVAIDMVACEGDTVLFDGVLIPAGQSHTFNYLNEFGCDSIMVVGVLTLPPESSSLALQACEGDSVLFDGVLIPAGQSHTFTYMNALGCDSLVTVNVQAVPPESSSLALQACEGESALFDGVLIPAGQSHTFTYMNALGCDSLVTVNVQAVPPESSSLALQACEGESALFDGVLIPAGQSHTFTYMNALGCDSLVTVNVQAIPPESSALALQACQGDFVDYNGVQLAPGDQQTFTLANQSGCDSLVTVTVTEAPTNAVQLSLPACANSFAIYNGQNIFPGQVKIFTFNNQFGCDSVVIVSVFSLPVSQSSLVLQACQGGTAVYNGVQIAPGGQQKFTLTNQYGCDSVVTVSVTIFPPVSYDLNTQEICWNSMDGTIQVANQQGSTAPYLYSLDSQTFQTGTSFDSLPGGTYTVYLQDINDCVYEKTVAIPVTPPMIVEVKDESVVCGDSIQLEPLVFSHTPVIWLWDNGSAEPFITVGSPGTYNFEVSNQCETVQKSVNVALADTGPVSLIYIPNAFSPNGDAINDCIKGYLAPNVQLVEYQLKIFDRWGDMMFETYDIDGCWDGKRKGRPMDPAVFVYFLTFRALNCDGSLIEIFKEGGIHLMR